MSFIQLIRCYISFSCYPLEPTCAFSSLTDAKWDKYLLHRLSSTDVKPALGWFILLINWVEFSFSIASFMAATAVNTEK